MIAIPDNFLLSVQVYQFHLVEPTLPPVILNNKAAQVTEYLRRLIGIFSYKDSPFILVTTDELHVLRLLRHVREEVDGIRLNKNQLIFAFDNPDDGSMVSISPTDDGELDQQVPGGFFTQRTSELF
jgi:hypothetical protein